MKHIKLFEDIQFRQKPELVSDLHGEEDLDKSTILDTFKSGNQKEISDILYGKDRQDRTASKFFSNINNIKTIIEGGVDPNYEYGLFLRTAIRNDKLDIMKYLIENGALIEARRYMAIKLAAELGKTEALEYLLSKAKNAKQSDVDNWKIWVETSDKESDEVKQKSLDIINKFKPSI